MYKKLILSSVLSSFLLATSAYSADLNTPQTILQKNNNDFLNLLLDFPNPETGDLYVSTRIAGQFLFLANNQLNQEIIPFQANQTFSGQLNLLSLPSAGIAKGRYPIYQVVAITDS